MKHTQFDYVNHFHCLAGSCPDTCCKDWQIILDEDAMARYRAMPGALGEQVRAAMLTQNGETRFREQDGKCVLLREDGLCPIQAAYGADAVTVSPYGGSACLEAGGMLPIAAVRTGGQVQTLVAGDRALWLSVAEQMARRGAALSVSTGYSLDVRDVRRVCPNAFLLLPDCDGENALPAFDDMGHGALLTDSRLQYESDPAAAIERAVKELKQWVTVV